MSAPFNHVTSRVLARCLRADGTLAPYQTEDTEEDAAELGVTWHEILAHLQHYGARELARAAGQDSAVWPGLLAMGMRADRTDCDGKTALHHAIELGRAAFCGYYPVEGAVPKLLEQGADPDALNSDGKTPLQLAVDLHFLSVVRRLRQAGATLGGGQTFAPADPAEPQSSRDAVAVYLALGGNLEAPPGGFMPDPHDEDWNFIRRIDTDEVARDHDSRTAFLEAVDAGDLPLVQALASAGADIHAQRIDYGCGSAVARAAMRARVPVMRQLLAWGLPLRVPAVDVQRLLDACLASYCNTLSFARHNFPDPAREAAVAECVALLLEQGERPNTEEFLLACADLRLLEIFWPYAPHLDAAQNADALRRVCDAEFGITPGRSRARFARAFLQGNADPNFNFIERWPLNSALHHGDSELIALLQAAGAIKSETCIPL